MYTVTSIPELRELQKQEELNNFPNGDLWNQLDDICYNLIEYGQETTPKNIIEDGIVIGYQLENGEKVFYE